MSYPSESLDLPAYVIHTSSYYKGEEVKPVIDDPPLLLHAPVPLLGQTPLLYSNFKCEPYTPDSPGQCSGPYHYQIDPEATAALCEPQPYPLNFNYCTGDPLQPTFPTPSELLAEIDPASISTIQTTSNDEVGSDIRAESARKARRRAMAKSIGFMPTDPDTISSHEKKRHYLECLEQYIYYLHNQFELIKATAPSMQRVGNYRGLTNRSIRTLLVHMEHTTRRLNQQTISEEENFLSLSDAICSRQED